MTTVVMDEEFDKSFAPDEGTPAPGGEMELHLDLDGFEGLAHDLVTSLRSRGSYVRLRTGLDVRP